MLASGRTNDVKESVHTKARDMWKLAEQAIAELHDRIELSHQITSDMTPAKQPRSHKRWLTYRQRLQELRQALAVDFRDRLA